LRKSHFIILPCFLLAVCSKRAEKQTYTELFAKPAGSGKLESPHTLPAISGLENFGKGGISASPIAKKEPGITWKTPRQWIEKPGTGMRLVSFQIEEGECTIVKLGPMAGGLESNLTRWAGQLQIPWDKKKEARIIQLKKEVPLPSGETIAIYNFTPFSKNGKGMISGIVKTPTQTVFVKLTGPLSMVKKESENFQVFCRSINLSAHPSAPAQTPKNLEMAGRQSSIDGPKPKIPPKILPKNLTSEIVSSGKGLAWWPPKSWSPGKKSSMRTASFLIPSKGTPGDCSVIFLPGSAGGLEMNISRWAGQIGVQLAGDELKGFIAKQRKIQTGAGFQFVLVDLIPNQKNVLGPCLLGAIGRFGEQSVFVKMTGNKTLVAEQQQIFEDFCKSFKKMGV